MPMFSAQAIFIFSLCREKFLSDHVHTLSNTVAQRKLYTHASRVNLSCTQFTHPNLALRFDVMRDLALMDILFPYFTEAGNFSLSQINFPK